ncbi:T9SS type A sorting domain-containing protein [Flavobacterium sp. WG21]|uniref:T9SS type A sorting domain-containing protein n=1 Tax=Flavobacterium sp. WG21 TaxID=1229487 RepID=UPI00035F8251|nr:T9SS type A sorting domain-containing protein [Flavobacterium sp. WG21]
MKTKLLFFILFFNFINLNAQQKIYDFYGNPDYFINFKDHILFEGYTEEFGRELWKSDGTSNNTTLLSDINPGKEPSYPLLFEDYKVVFKNELYFVAGDKNSSNIWKTDGTTEGTIKITNFANERVSKLAIVGNYVFFLVKLGNTHQQVWRTNGSIEGPEMIKDITGYYTDPSFVGQLNGNFIFTISAENVGSSRIWRSDGTTEGTYPISPLLSGNGSGYSGTSSLSQYITFNGKMYFIAKKDLYETDGTLENTKSIGGVFNAQSDLVDYSSAIEVNNNLYFIFFSANKHKLSIWRFDPTNRTLNEIYTHTSQKYFSPSNFIKIDNSLLFLSSNETGAASLVSFDFATYKVSNLKQLSNTIEQTDGFVYLFDCSKIFKINNNEYFISEIDKDKYSRKGWIFNRVLNTIENISVLDNIRDAIVYNGDIYYAKGRKLWKYSNNLSTPLIESRSSLVFYPNPTTDFVNLQTENNNEFENAQIFDLNGKLVSDETDFTTDKIDVSKLNPGTYILKAKVNGVIVSKKIIKN